MFEAQRKVTRHFVAMLLRARCSTNFTRLLLYLCCFEVVGAIHIFAPLKASAQCSIADASITPCSPTATVHIGSTSQYTFTVYNSNIPHPSFTFTCSRSGVVASCSVAPTSGTSAPGFPATITLTYTTTTTTGSGSVVVTATRSGGGVVSSTLGVTAVNDFWFSPFDNQTGQPLSVCAASCFAGATSFSTVPYYTLDAPRNVTLAYTEERANPRPIIMAMVGGMDASATWPSYYYVEATLSGTSLTFTNGDTRLYFEGSPAQYKEVPGQFDAHGYSTGVYPLTVTVTGVFPGGSTVQKSFSQNLVIVNESHSPVGKGWTIAGIQRLYFPAMGGYLVTEGDGSAIYYPSLNTPAMDFSRLTYSAGTNTYTRTYADTAQVVFAASGLATSVTDRLGNQTTFGYDGSSRLQTITEPLRNRQGAGSNAPYLVLAYNSTGLASITETGGIGTGRTTTIRTTSDSMIRAIIDPDGDSTTYTYDPNKRLSTKTDRRGGLTTYVYDSLSWKIKEIQLPQVAVNAGGGATTNVMPRVKYIPWQGQGLPSGPTSIANQADGGPSDIRGGVIDPLGRMIMDFRVDSLGQPTDILFPTGVWSYVHRNGLLPYEVVHGGIGTDTIQYYSGTPFVSRVRTVGDSAVNYHYGAKGQIDSVWGPGLPLEQRYLNTPTGRTDSIQYNHEDSTKIRFTYDSWNRVLTSKDPKFHITAYRYDPVFGNIDSMGLPSNLYSLHRFDQFGRDSATWRSGASSWTRTLYDSLNRVRKTWHASLANDTTVITYDDLYPVRVLTPGGQVNKFEVNALGWITRRYDVGDTTRYLAFRYDTAGRLTSWTNRRGQRVDRTYDVRDRLLTQTRGGLTDTYTYSTTGNWQTAWRPNVSRDSLYLRSSGSVDSLVRKIAGHRYVLQYKDTAYTGGQTRFDKIISDLAISFVQRTHRTIYVGSAGYVIMRDTLVGPTESAVNRPQVQYNPDGLPVAIQWSLNDWGLPPSYVIQQFTSRHQRYQDTVNTNVGSTARSDSLSRRYAYDSLGRLAFEHWKSGTGSIRRRFTYDPWSRLRAIYKNSGSLCSATLDTVLGSQFASCTATTMSDSADYDSLGNRRKSGDAYDPGNRLRTWPGTTGTVTYTYDLDGNVATRTHGGVTDSLFWSATNELDSVRSGGTRLVYEYNSMGQLVRRQRNGVYDRFFLWDQAHLIAELNSTGNRIAQYMYHDGTDRPFAIATDSGTKTIVRYYFQDVQGGVLGIMRNEKLVRYTPYTPWGLSDSSAATTLTALKDTSRIAWKGLLYEGDSTKLYYARTRWYDPQAGRFLSEDPLGIAGSANLYTFANNDPVNAIDPSGTCTITVTQHYSDGYTTSHKEYVAPGQSIRDSEYGRLWCGCDDVTFQGSPPICPEHNSGSSVPAGGGPSSSNALPIGEIGRFLSKTEEECTAEHEECSYQCSRFTNPARRSRCFRECTAAYARCLADRPRPEPMDEASRFLADFYQTVVDDVLWFLNQLGKPHPAQYPPGLQGLGTFDPLLR